MLIRLLCSIDFIQAAIGFGLGLIDENVMRDTFRQFDTNHNGNLEISEALKVMDRLQFLRDKLAGRSTVGNWF